MIPEPETITHYVNVYELGGGAYECGMPHLNRADAEKCNEEGAPRCVAIIEVGVETTS